MGVDAGFSAYADHGGKKAAFEIIRMEESGSKTIYLGNV